MNDTTKPQSENEGDIKQEVIDVAKQTMVGDMRDVCLQIMRDKKLTGKAWSDMSEGEQKDVVGIITDRVADAVVKSVQIIAANGQRQIRGTLQQVVVKDGIKAVLECSQFDELRHELMDAQGESVAIVLTGAEEYTGVGEKVKIDKDQPDMLEENEEGIEADETDEDEIEAEDTGAEGQLEQEANQYT